MRYTFRSFVICFFLTICFSGSAQHRLLLDKQFHYPDENIGYTYINDVPNEDNLLYLAIVDLQRQEVVDFVFHGLNDKVIEGNIRLDKNINPGYYALMAFRYGDSEVHYEQFWVRDLHWQRMGARLSLDWSDNHSLSLQGRVQREAIAGTIWLSHDSTTLLSQDFTLNEEGGGGFEFSWLLEQLGQQTTEAPIWATIQLWDAEQITASHRFPVYWPAGDADAFHRPENSAWLSFDEAKISIHPQELGEFYMEAWDEVLTIEDPIFPEDSITYAREDLPTGLLKLSFKAMVEARFQTVEIWNYPQMNPMEQAFSLSTRTGEEVILPITIQEHPWLSSDTHFLFAKLDETDRTLLERYRGKLSMKDTLGASKDVIIMKPNSPIKSMANRAVLFTNGEYSIDFNTDQKGEFSLSRHQLSMFGFEQGRLRYREEESKIRLEPFYPGVDEFTKELKELLSGMAVHIVEANQELANLDKSFDTLSFDDFIIDLEEVLVGGKSLEERIEEVLDDPFAVDWLNEEWVCQHLVLGGGGPDCYPAAGNHPNVAFKIPLHLLLTESFFAMRRNGPTPGQMLRVLRNPPPGIDPRAKSKREEVILHLTKGLRYYSWNPNDFLDQIGSLKLPKQNMLQLTEVPFAIQNKQKRWSPLMEYPEIKIKAPSLPGVYALEISFWDLHHDISSTLRYEIEVK